jgi:hypothetical protein
MYFKSGFKFKTTFNQKLCFIFIKGVFKSLKPPLTLKARCRPFISLKVDLNGEHNLNYMTSDISLG